MLLPNRVRPVSDLSQAQPAADFDLSNESNKLALLCGILCDINLDGIVAAVGHADALGPFLAPTEYRDMLYRKGNMHDAAKLAQLAQPLQKAARELREAVAR